jgi:C1A family cysteine protease
MEEEKQFFSGYIESPVDVRDYRIAVDKTAVFPETYELDIVRIKNQGSTGSCVAHALSEVVEYYNKKQLNKTTEQSICYIYGNRRNSVNKDEGMITREALSNLVKWGDVAKTKCPGNPEVPEAIKQFEAVADSLKEEGMKNRITAYYTCKSEAEVKTALMNHGPVVIAIDWYNDMKVVNGVLTTKYDKKVGGHCMVIYGWNEKGWLVQNSWGKTWGNQGTCIIPYDMTLREKWGVTDDIIEDDNSDIDIPFATKLLEFLARIINFFANLFKGKK